MSRTLLRTSMPILLQWLGCLFFIVTAVEASASGRSVHAWRKMLTNINNRESPRNGWLRSIPAIGRASRNSSSDAYETSHSVTEVAAVKKRKRKRPEEPQHQPSSPSLPDHLRRFAEAGTYYGLTATQLKRVASTDGESQRVSVRDTMSMTLQEIRSMRQEMEALRKDLRDMKRSVLGAPDDEDSEDIGSARLAQKKERVKEYDRISNEVEEWAQSMLFESPESEWTEVACNKVMRHLNSQGRTRAYLRWLPDSRGKHARSGDEREYPCLKIYSTVDAPLEEVCTYLAQEQKMADYNDLVVRHGDVEELSPDSKICFGRTPKILFIKPREFITYCRHRWTREGVQVMVNQACHDEEALQKKQDAQTTEDGGLPRAFALRGAHFISPHPDDPEKTQVAMIAHGNPGMDIPDWAIKTAIKAVAPIEPFKLFHKINKGVRKSRPELTARLDEIRMAGCSPSGRSPRPAGMAQLGFACFWPNGGGFQEGWKRPSINASSLIEHGDQHEFAATEMSEIDSDPTN